VDFAPIDADHHYYETLDAFTRHLDPKFAQRGVQLVQQGTRTYLLMGGQVNRFIPNPTFDPIIVPGCIDLMFGGQVPEGVKSGRFSGAMVFSPASSIYGGTDEIQRNIIAERTLGLPRELLPGKGEPYGEVLRSLAR
jgi:hypothetical protein